MTRQSKKSATVASVLKRGHTNSDGEHPVKIRVTYNRVQRFYPVIIDGKPLYMKDSDFDKLLEKKVRKELKAHKDDIQKVVAAAITARDKITVGRLFTFDRFEKEFLTGESGHGFMALFDRYLKDLIREGRIGTYKSYKNALEAFRSFRNGRDIAFEDITPALLKDFEAYMYSPRRVPNRRRPLKAGKNTVAMYMRALKVIYNNTAVDIPHLKESYPFATSQNDRGKYKIRTGPGKKADAMSVEEIQEFIGTSPIEDTPEHRAKLIWLFSFYCQGMNFRDIALLQYKDVGFDAIRYVRHKTKDTESNEDSMEVPLSEPMKEIILSIGNPNKRPSSYVFEILTPGLDARQQDATIRQGIKITNKWLERLCRENNLTRITTYTARHSYANLLKQSGESVELIRELLGHSDIRTTEAYLKRFDLSKKREANQRIESLFKKKSA